jgi:hypothetical protein
MSRWTRRLIFVTIFSTFGSVIPRAVADDFVQQGVQRLQQVWESRSGQVRTARIHFRFVAIPPARINETLVPEEVAALIEIFDDQLTIDELPQCIEFLSSMPEDVGGGIDVLLTVDGNKRSEETRLIRQTTNTDTVIRHSKSNRQIDLVERNESHSYSHRMSDLAIPNPVSILEGFAAGRIAVDQVEDGQLRVSAESTSGRLRVEYLVSNERCLIDQMDLTDISTRTLTNRIYNLGYRETDGIWFPTASAAFRFKNGRLRSAYLRIITDSQFNNELDAGAFDVPVKKGETVVDHRLDPPRVFTAAEDVSNASQATPRLPPAAALPGAGEKGISLLLLIANALLILLAIGIIARRRQLRALHRGSHDKLR